MTTSTISFVGRTMRRSKWISFGEWSISFLNFEYVKAVSHTEIHDAWEKLGKQKRTPMTESGIQSWLASEFPLVAPDVALTWIKDHAIVAPGDERRCGVLHEDAARSALARTANIGDSNDARPMRRR